MSTSRDTRSPFYFPVRLFTLPSSFFTSPAEATGVDTVFFLSSGVAASVFFDDCWNAVISNAILEENGRETNLGNGFL